jgi:hypothetical protein
MESATGPEGSFQVYLLTSFALGLFLAGKCLVQMAFPRLRVARVVELVSGLGALVLVFLLGLDAFCQGGVLVEVATPLRFSILMGTGAALVAAHFGVSLLPSGRRQLALQPVAWLAVALTLGATAWSSHRYSVGKLRIEMDSTFGKDQVERDAIQDWVAVTDRGREVTLFRFNRQGSGTAAVASSSAEQENLKANCHGWVFAGGQYLLWRDGVERILQDNGYQICETPQPGDLIIYRNDVGEPVHTGLVKAGVWGGILIESKWGVGKRFVHSPEMQPYGDRYSYYRSSRQGHAITIRAARQTMSVASLSPTLRAE